MDVKSARDSLSMSSSPRSAPDYEPLRNKEETDSIDGLDMLHLQRHQRPRRRKIFRAVKILGGLGLVAFIVLTFALSFHAVELLGKIGVLIKQPKPVSQQRSYKYPCGLSAAEAKQKGCIFDVMSMAWQSPECFDEDLHEEFMDQGPWEFYSSPEATPDQMLTYDQVSQKGQISWTNRRYFVIHCIYGWKAMHRAWQRGWRMDANLASIAHTELCTRVFANTSIPMEAMTTRIHVDFPSCN